MGLTSLDIDGSVPSHFETIARRYPDRLAVICDTGELTYGELNLAANQLAHRLLRSGHIGDRVALLPSADSSMFAAMLAALKAGRMVAVLNPGDPVPRLRQLLVDCEPRVILTTGTHAILAEEIAGASIEVVRIDDESLSSLPSTNPGLPLGPDNFVSIVYTSGSTGQPKGVVRSHGNVLRACMVSARSIDMTPDDRAALLGAAWGGQGMNLGLAVLLCGAMVVPFAAVDRGVTGLAAWLNDRRITVYHSASSLFRHFMKTIDAAASFPHVRIVRISSDAATWEDFTFRKHFPNATMITSMGASEVGPVAAGVVLPGDEARAGRVPVGRPQDGVEIRIVDDEGRDCPPGTVGTMSIRSRFLADGYWRDPVLTAQSFFDCGDGTRVFRSNDLARMDADGVIELAGRRDAAYKIRGLRVDITEVEQALSRLPGVDEAAAVVATRSNREPYLLAYVVAAAGSSPSPQKLRAAARGLMARHLVPAIFVMVDALPRTANGKVDRVRLREIAPPPRAGAAEPAVTETERLLVGLWEQAFDLEAVGRSEDFFDLGGDSLIGAVIAAGVHAAKGVELRFRTFIEHPVLEDMAAVVDRLSQGTGASEEPPLTAVRRDGPVPLSLLQEPFWQDSRAPDHSRRYTRAAIVRIDGHLDLDAFRASLGSVIARHEILRTRFGLEDGVPLQIVEPAGAVPLSVVDLSGAADADEQVDALLKSEGNRLFDLSAGPPLKFILMKVAGDCHLLIRSCHHIISDAPSWNVFFRDLGAAYEARIEGREPFPQPLPIQFADYSIWQRRVWRHDGSRHRDAVAWWKKQFQQQPVPSNARWLTRYLRTSPAGGLRPDEGYLSWGIDAESAARLDKLGRQEAATYYMVRLAALGPVLASLIGHDAVAIAGIFTNRHRVVMEGMFGPLLNPIPMIFRCDWGLTFRDLIKYARQLVLDAQEYAEIPFSGVLAELKAQQVDIPSVFVRLQVTTPMPPLHFAGLTLSLSKGVRADPRGIMVRLNPLREEDGCLLGFDARIYSAASMQDFIDRFARFMYVASRNPDATVGSLIERDGAEREFEQPLA